MAISNSPDRYLPGELLWANTGISLTLQLSLAAIRLFNPQLLIQATPFVRRSVFCFSSGLLARLVNSDLKHEQC